MLDQVNCNLSSQSIYICPRSLSLCYVSKKNNVLLLPSNWTRFSVICNAISRDTLALNLKIHLKSAHTNLNWTFYITKL